MLQGESKEVQTNVTIYSHALLRIHIIGGHRSVWIVPPSLPPHHSDQQPGTSSPPSWLKHSSEGVIWMCRAFFTNSSCPLPWSSTVVSSQMVILPCMLRYSWLHHHASPCRRHPCVPSVSSPVSSVRVESDGILVSFEFEASSLHQCSCRGGNLSHPREAQGRQDTWRQDHSLGMGCRATGVSSVLSVYHWPVGS